MSPKPHRDSYRQLVTDLVEALTDATRLAEAAYRQAEREEGIRSASAGAMRLLDRWRQQRPTLAVEDEIRRFGDALLDLHRQLPDEARAVLKADVRRLAVRLPEQTAWRSEVLAEPVRSRYATFKMDARKAGASLHNYVHEALERIIPADTGGITSDDAPPPGSLLSPGAHAFTHDHAVRERIVGIADDRPNAWWKVRMRREGLEAMLPAITEQAGGDPLEAVRLTNRFLGGVLLGTRLDENTLNEKRTKLTGPVVVDPTHTTLVIGASGTGKTTSVVGPYAVQRAALGDNVVVVTPQPPTIGLILPTAKALSGQEHVPVIDFGGEIVGRESSEFYTWDVTRNCLTTEGAMEFADAFAGPKLPARAQLNNPEYWGGIVWDMYGAAGHIAAGMRELRGLDPHGLNGMARVYDLLRSPRPDDVPNDLPATVRTALASSPAKLRSLEALFQDAKAYAEPLDPRLRRIAFQEHILRAQGVPLSDEIVGEKLESLSEVLNQIGKSRNGDPMESLLTTFKRAVPPHERLVMSPRPGDNEIDPKDLVRPGAGVSFVAYAHTGTTGLAAGAFTSQVLDAAILQNKDVGMLRAMGSTDSLARLSLVVDEGGAGRYIPRLPDIVTDTRQLGISAMVSMTSEHHLRSVFGEEDAGKFLHAPCVIDLSPDAHTSTATAPLFGQRIVERESHAGWSETKENILEASDVSRLGRGEGVVKYQSDPAGERVKIVQLPQLEDTSTVVGAAAAHVQQHPEEFEPMSELLKRFRPDLSEIVALQADPTAALMEGSAESVAAALADPGEEPAVVAEVASESVAELLARPAVVEVAPESVPEVPAQPAVVEVAPESVPEVPAQPAVVEVTPESVQEVPAHPAVAEVTPETVPEVPARSAVVEVAPEPEPPARVEVRSLDDWFSQRESTDEVAPEPVLPEAPPQPAADEFSEAEVEENPNKI